MSDANTATRGWSRFFERELGLLIILVLGLYATRLTDLTIRGEESRRGRIAWEMVHSGDWLIPRVQGLPRLSRPPLQYWTIALLGELRGAVDAVAVRLPSVISTLLTVLLIYGYGRCWMSRIGALASAASYATFAQVLQLGRLGETEAIFTFLLSAALLTWHAGVLLRWNPWVLWSAAYVLMAAATLTKGPQAPAYFTGGIGMYLLLSRNWRIAVSWSHAAGVALFLALVGAWQIPFSQALGNEKVSYVYLSEVAKRFEDTQWSTIMSHLTLFPFEVVIGCLFPWSLLLLAYARRDFRVQLTAVRLPVLYLVGCIAVAFPTVWIPPEARARYFMPLFPCFALLCGYVVECWATASNTAYRGYFEFARSRPRLAVIIAASLIGVAYVGPIMSYQVARSADAQEDVARVKQVLPTATELSSFGVVHHLFSYYFAAPITHHEWPAAESAVPSDVEYFCIDVERSKHKPLPFKWVEVARVNCDRNRRKNPEAEVVIGRRVKDQEPVAASLNSPESLHNPNAVRLSHGEFKAERR